MVKWFVAFGVAALIGHAVVRTQEQGCLHGASESADQSARRRAALALARQMNTSEAATFAQGRRYSPINELSITPAAPQGWDTQLSTDGATYIFSVKDTMDACQFAFFSDQSRCAFRCIF